MPLTPDAATDLLREARRLNEERAYPELARLLEPWAVDDLGVEPDLIFLRADVGRRLGRAEAAIADLDALDTTTRRYGNVRLRRRRLNLLGSLRFEAGEVGRAHIIVEPGQPLDLDELDAWARERLASFKLPRRFVTETDLPRTASGKVQKHRLAAPN